MCLPLPMRATSLEKTFKPITSQPFLNHGEIGYQREKGILEVSFGARFWNFKVLDLALGNFVHIGVSVAYLLKTCTLLLMQPRYRLSGQGGGS